MILKMVNCSQSVVKSWTAALLVLSFVFIVAQIYIKLPPRTARVRQTSNNNIQHVPSLDPKCIIPTRNMQELVLVFKDFKRRVEQNTNTNCNEAFQAVTYLFDFHLSRERRIEIPDPMRGRVQDWVGSDPGLLQSLVQPTILTIRDKWTHDTVGWNPLRSMRPTAASKKEAEGNPELDMTDQLIKDTASSCDFCAKNRTAYPADLDRVENAKYDVYTAANAFGFLDMVGMVIPRKFHDFRRIDWPTFQAIFDDVIPRWFWAVHEEDAEMTHPHIVWDAMPHAGASQVHPHLQTFLGRGGYLGKTRLLYEAAVAYKDALDRDYFVDYALAHSLFGLVFTLNRSLIIAPLTAQLDHEFVILDFPDQPDMRQNRFVSDDWVRGFHLAQRTLLDELGVLCFTSAMAWPSITKPRSHSDLAVGKIGSRGACDSPSSDMSSLNIYSATSLQSNLIENMQALKTTYKKLNQVT